MNLLNENIKFIQVYKHGATYKYNICEGKFWRLFFFEIARRYATMSLSKEPTVRSVLSWIDGEENISKYLLEIEPIYYLMYTTLMLEVRHLLQITEFWC